MRNAKQELWKALGEKSSEFEGAQITWARKKHTFRQGELEKLLKFLNFEYDTGYGSQELSGFVLLSEGRWLERGEYDGMEWWEMKKRPTLD